MRSCKLGLILGLTFLVSANARAQGWQPGDNVRLSGGASADTTPVAVDLFAYVDMAQAFIAGDKVGLAELEKEKRMVRVWNGTTAKVITTGSWPKVPNYAEVRLTSGTHTGEKVHVSQGNLRNAR